ncbi:hypothetical protein JCM19046_2849 [Bacillus sp. JCM 19046]|nr:hypothetical protein JCM19046_2849 [Bacillus sp. JCM 19046]
MGASSKHNLKWLGALLVMGIAIFSFTFFHINKEQAAQSESSGGSSIANSVLADASEEDSLADVDSIENAFAFGEPVLIENTRIGDTSGELIDAMDGDLLFLGENEHLYFYDRTTEEALSIDDGVGAAAFAQDDSYVLYSVHQDRSNSEVVRYVYLEEMGKQATAMTLPDVEDIDSLDYHNGILYVTYGSTEDPDTYDTEAAALASSRSNDQHSFWKGTSPAFTTHDGKMLTYSPERHALSYLTAGTDEQIQWQALDSALEITEIALLDLNEYGEYVIVDETAASGATRLYLPTGEVAQFQRTQSVGWIDSERLLVLDDHVLYLYDTKAKDSLPLFEGAIASFVVDHTIYLQASTMEVYAIEIIQ